MEEKSKCAQKKSLRKFLPLRYVSAVREFLKEKNAPEHIQQYKDNWIKKVVGQELTQSDLMPYIVEMAEMEKERQAKLNERLNNVKT